MVGLLEQPSHALHPPPRTDKIKDREVKPQLG